MAHAPGYDAWPKVKGPGLGGIAQAQAPHTRYFMAQWLMAESWAWLMLCLITSILCTVLMLNGSWPILMVMMHGPWSKAWLGSLAKAQAPPHLIYQNQGQIRNQIRCLASVWPYRPSMPHILLPSRNETAWLPHSPVPSLVATRTAGLVKEWLEVE